MTINNLKTLFIILFICLAIFNYYLFKYFYESPRWLHSRERKKECLEVLANVARFNNIEKEWNLYQKNNPEIIQLIGSKKQDYNQNGNKFGACFYGIILYLDEMKGNFF